MAAWPRPCTVVGMSWSFSTAGNKTDVQACLAQVSVNPESPDATAHRGALELAKELVAQAPDDAKIAVSANGHSDPPTATKLHSYGSFTFDVQRG